MRVTVGELRRLIREQVQPAELDTLLDMFAQDKSALPVLKDAFQESYGRLWLFQLVKAVVSRAGIKIRQGDRRPSSMMFDVDEEFVEAQFEVPDDATDDEPVPIDRNLVPKFNTSKTYAAVNSAIESIGGVPKVAFKDEGDGIETFTWVFPEGTALLQKDFADCMLSVTLRSTQ